MKPSIEELLISDARGEPMAVDERRRLETALRRSAHVASLHRSQRALTEDLAALRGALRELPAPELSADALHWAFRAHAAASRRGTRQRRTRTRLRAAGAAVLLAGVAAVLLALQPLPWSGRAEPDRVETSVAERPEASADKAADLEAASTAAGSSGAYYAFQPLPYAPPPSPSDAYSVVRVRIPLESIAIPRSADLRGVLEAEILIGEDGLAHGIRFTNPEPLLVSNDFDSPGETR